METRVGAFWLGYELPPLIFDQPPSRSKGRLLSDDSVNAEGSEDARSEFKIHSSLGSTFKTSMYVITDDYYQPYLEAQTDSIVYAIQSILSDICTPQHLHRSTKTSLKLLPSFPASLLSVITNSHPRLFPTASPFATLSCIMQSLYNSIINNSRWSKCIMFDSLSVTTAAVEFSQINHLALLKQMHHV